MKKNTPSKKLKIFADRKYLPKGAKHEWIMYPFWGKNPEDPNQPDTGRFDEYLKEGRNYFELTSLQDCDAAVYPAPYHLRGPELQQLISDAQKYNKPVIIFFNHDSDEEVKIPNAYIFRTSFYRSTRKLNEFALSGWSEDFTKKYFNNQLHIRQKSATPTVGYCGYSCSLPKKIYIKLLLKEKTHGHYLLREKIIKILKKSPVVNTNFFIRPEKWQKAWSIHHSASSPTSRRSEFLRNLIDSDYCLATRGAGNFSYRLYEILSVGRIPVFVDTDCVLPYEKQIDWKKICVWVDVKEIDQIGEKVAKFHKSLSPQQFVDLQITCRKIWEEWISPQGFFKNFYRHFN